MAGPHGARVSADSATLADYLTVEMDLTSGPLATPSWSTVDPSIVAGGEVTIGRGGIGPDDGYGTGTVQVDIDNTEQFLAPTGWYRGCHLRVSTAGGVRLATSYVEKVGHDQSNAPLEASASIRAIDVPSKRIRNTLTGFGFTVPANGWLRPGGFNVPWTPPDFGLATSATYDRAELYRELVDNELGAMLVNVDGETVVVDRWWRLRKLAGAVDARFSDVEGDGYPILARADGGNLALSEPEEAYRDTVEFTGLSGRTQSAADVPADFEPVALSRSTRSPADAWMHANAVYLLAVLKDSDPFWRRFTVRVAPGALADAEAIAALTVGSLIQVSATPAGAPGPLESLLFVEQVTHRFSQAGPSWDIEFGCSNAAAWQNAWGTSADYLTYDTGQNYDDGLNFWP